VLDGGHSACRVSPYDFQPSAPDPGVTCGQRYHPFSIGQDDITIERSTAPGHDGTVVIDGGRDTPLPYCGQKSYSAVTGANAGIDLNGHSGVTIDGTTRSGIVVRGARNGSAHQRVMVSEPAGQGHRQVRHLPGGPQPGLRQARHHAAAALPADQRLDHRRRRGPGNIGHDRGQVDPGRLQRFLQPLDLRGAG
jgi:hypothetical protein